MNFIFSFLLSALSFGSPVHIPVQLAGNFGEPRPNHFHGGVDVKTDREVNIGVYSIADGYISGAVIEKYGWGHAIKVTHPNGYTSFYFHLNKFVPQIEAAVKKYQYQHKQYACDVTFAPGQFPVKKGQLIAISGNTGASEGPHIHIEYHRTKGGNMIDPLTVLKSILIDKTAPTVYSFKAYPQPGEGIFQHTQKSQIYSFVKGAYHAWGKVGFGVRANDHMDGVYNNFGVRFTKLYCDGKLIFSSDVNDIPVEDNRMINSWGDYQHFLRTKIWYLKSFIEPGNRLPILRAVNRGIIDFNQERDYHLRYELSDIYGNKTVKEIIVHGTPEKIAPKESQKGLTPVYYNKVNNLQFEGVKLAIEKGMVGETGYISPKRVFMPDAYSVAYSFSSGSFPLFGYNPIGLKVSKGSVANPEKLYVACRNGIGAAEYPMYCGGTYEDGWVKGQLRDFGLIYYLAYDDKAPLITKQNGNPHHLYFKITDTGSGLQGYQAYIDNRFVLFGFGKNKQIIFCDLADTPILATHKSHVLKIIATDNRNNTRVFTTNITY